ncbi:MAG: hypothetical protein JSV85_02410 [Candidatus Bathyarchaeota archaeon]|nr:MAG: hypothetical protein JSV85_02410 [Candidatus Bathyarchaeota archaeon]
MKIEVFVENEEVPVQKVQVKGVCRHLCDAYETFKTERILDEDSKRALKEARKKAKDFKAEVTIYDLATTKGRLVARLRGVKSPSWKIVE